VGRGSILITKRKPDARRSKLSATIIHSIVGETEEAAQYHSREIAEINPRESMASQLHYKKQGPREI
jgi:hypothetical protein